MIYLDSCADESRKISLTEISASIDSPSAYTAKILQQLKRNGLLTSTIGAKGGFQVPNNKAITIRDIIIAIDGDTFFNRCVLGLKVCSSENPCPAHSAYTAVKESLNKRLFNLKISEFSKKLKNKTITLK